MKNSFLLIVFCCVYNYAFTQNTWQQTSGPNGGTIYAMARTTEKVFVGTDNGLWQSINEGATWTMVVGAVPPDQRVIAIYTSNSEVLALSIKLGANSSEEATFWRSVDNGQSWTLQKTISQFAWRLSFKGAKLIRQGAIIWAVPTNGEPVRSMDDGVTWSEVRLPSGQTYDPWAVNGDKILAFDLFKYHRSEDGGMTWETTIDSQYVQGIFFDGDIIIKIVTGDSIWISNDFGLTWQGEKTSFYDLGGIIRLEDGSFAHFSRYVYTSLDGLHWQKRTTDHAIISRGVVSGDGFLVGGSGGIYKLLSGSTNLQDSENGFIGIGGTAIKAMGNGRLVFASSGQTWSSFDKGQSWQPFLASKGLKANETIQTMAAKGDTLFAVVGDSLRRLIGNSWDWEKLTDNDSWFSGETFVRIFGDEIFLVEDKQVRRSLDGGTTWQVLLRTTSIGGFRDILRVGNFLFYSTNEGEVYRSNDNGISWQLSTEIRTPGAHRYNKLSTAGGRIFLWSEYEAFYSANQGTTWNQLKLEGLPTNSWGDPFFEPIDIVHFENLIFCTIPYNGVWASFDFGNTWQPINNGLTNLRQRYLTISDGYLYSASSTSGVWRLGAQFDVFSGVVFNDLNFNGQKDNGEPPMKEIIVSAQPIGSYTAADDNGAFSIVASSNLDTISVTSPSKWGKVAPLARPAGLTGSGYDFAVQFQPDVVDLHLDVVNREPFRPGFDNVLTLTVKNIGTVSSPTSQCICILPPGVMAFNTSSITIRNDSAIWQIGPLAPYEKVTIDLYVLVASNVMIDQVLSFEASLIAQRDLDESNNRFLLREAVVGSYDPNDKSAVTGISPEEISSGKPIEYVIRFENTGNFFAEKVVIKDALEARLSPTTFKFISSSHPCTWTIKEEGAIQFTFRDIFLSPMETGYVKFSVEAHRNLRLGDAVSNKAEIIFDFNEPIVTNTVRTTVKQLSSSKNLSVESLKMFLVPNPAESTTRCSLPKEALAKAAQLDIRASNGQLVWTNQNLSETMPIDVSSFSPGIFEAVLLDDKGQILASGRFVVNK